MKPLYTKWIVGIVLTFLSFFNLQAQTDTLCNPNEIKKIFGTAFLTYGGATNAFNSANRSDFTVGQAAVTAQNMLSQNRQTALGQWTPWLLPPQAPFLIASQGDYKDRIKISWSVNALSPIPTSFVLKRDGAFMAELGPDIQEYLDFNVQAGEYYQYSVSAKNGFGLGSGISYVGFVNPNGVVSGKIETNSGNPVPGVEVRLTPLTGSSMEFDGVSGQLCVSYANKFPTNAFTVSAYVKLNDTNNETGIIDWGSGLNKNWWITTTNNSDGKGYIFHIGNGTSSDTLKYVIPVNSTNYLNNDTKWHQITMMYNGSAMSVMVDGNFVGTKPASIVREKEKLNIGSKSTGGFFKGWIDDVRIYNRPLTQTEVNTTKNRSVSKTENGLLAYWKMDEGVGQKVFDNGSLPANATIYGNAKFSTDKPEVYSSGISDATGYYSIDGINYSQVESFSATPSKNIAYNSALEFSASNMSYANLTDYDMPDTATVEVLFYPFDLKSPQTILSKGSLYELYINNGKLFMNLNGTVSDLGNIDAKYHHVAVTMNNTNTKDNASIYLDGNLKFTNSFSGTSNWANGSAWLMGTNSTATTGKFYTGIIDEFAIYKKIMTQNQIQLHAGTGIPQDSTINDLFTYFDFNEGIDNKVYDYAAVNTPLQSARIGTITNATWSNNVKNSKLSLHEFQPNVRIVNLNNSNTAVGNVDFKDVSTVNVSGYVRFANTICFEDSVQIYSNGQPLFPAVRTDKNGKWSADFEPGVNIRLSALYGNHLFTPSFMEFRKLQAPKAGIVFLDNTKRTIRGQVAGGDCRKSIIPQNQNVRVVVKVATTDGCFVKTDTIRNADGKFVFNNLPARNYTVSIVEHSLGNIYTYFQTKGGQTVDLRNAVADTVDFIYYAPPQLEITGIAANKCGLRTVGQNVPNKIGVKVFQEYFGQKCYVSGPTLHIDDASMGSIIDTTLAAGVSDFKYKFVPRNVNIIAPYLQTITVRATANESSTTGTTQFVTLGLKKKGKNFTASTPQLPDFILRDPPGDASYAVLEKGSTVCNTKTTTIVNNFSQEVLTATSIGGTESIGFGLAIETTNKFTESYMGGGSETWTNSSANTTCVTTTKTITTSPNDVVVGSAAGGDVYVGKSESVTYGDATLLNLDFDNCSFYTKDQITIDSVRLNTDFVYSENFIVNSLMPSLKILSEEITNPKKKIDSVAYITWKRIIQSNKEDINPTKIKTISFDAGAVYEESQSMEETTAWSDSFDGAGFIQAGYEAEVDYLGGFTAGVTLRYDHVKSSAEDNQKTNATTITYHLEDNDPGDGFLINLYKGKKYGTYIFNTVAGQSSCPWEKGTKPRSEPSLISDDGNLKTNVPRNTSAVFQIELGNLSPTKEQRDYDISLVTGTNPDGAIVKIDGHVITSATTYTIPYESQNKILVTVDRGPLSYNYDDIQIQLTASCESNAYNQIPQGGGDYAKSLYGGNWADSLFTRYLSLSAHFIEPCSPIDIGFPLQGWVVTPASQNNLSITLNEYNKNDPNLREVRIQYRPIDGDGSWINITSIDKANLGALVTNFNWKTDLIQDGDFEIRAVAECTDANKASGISTVIKGSLQRTPPIVLGVPQPADGTWDPGDEISITFSKLIDCGRVIQADILSNNTIGLYDATTDKLVDATITCLGNKILIVPNISPIFFENRIFRVKLTGKDYDDDQLGRNPNYQPVGLKDKVGNAMAKTVIWEFYVNQNSLEWVGTEIHEANTVNQPFTLKRQIRNRGGSIMAYRMESIPSWLTVSPMNGTLNPGQVADISLTFQQDLLIGDYLDTLQLVGSQGSEPLLIDYKVRCPSPIWVVDNPSQYEGSMNMVVSLNIFGDDSKDPSDQIVARINGQIRGVANVAYYRNINKWLAFITVYGNSEDIDKNIEFNVWDGSKCNTYAEILEQIAYQEGEIVGNPITPQPIHVLNLISKLIPLNKGYNWLSFNLDLGVGNNTVSKTLSSLKNKTGALIKDDALFSKYYGNPINDWKNTLKNIIPQKRYMLYVGDKDTITLKGIPFAPKDFPILVVQGWNWIGYVPTSGISLNQGLKGLTPLNGDIIKSQTLFAQYVAGTGWVGNLSFLEPSKGYLLKISNSGTLVYPDPSVGGFGKSFNDPNNDPTLAIPENPLDFQFSQYQSNMNIIGRIEGIDIDPSDELRAYIDGKLAGLNKSIANENGRLFFQTVYHQDALNISFKLYKADRKKEYELDKIMTFKVDSLAGLVENPVVFGLVTNSNPTVALNLSDQLIQQPNNLFPSVSISAGVTPQGANCTTFTFNSILPMEAETVPDACIAQTGLEGNMVGVIKAKYNERSTFASSSDVLSFINPVNGNVIGCGSFDTDFNVFNYTVKGGTSSTETPVDVKYYSSLMHKTFTIKSAFTYKNNKELGDYNTPLSIDFSALAVATNATGTITAVMRDTSWTGKYCVQAFAMNCSDYNDGQATVCFQRLKVGDCMEVIVRNATETADGLVKALSISSQVQINSGVKMYYKGGNVIELKPGFTTQSNTFFIGQIEGCANNK